MLLFITDFTNNIPYRSNPLIQHPLERLLLGFFRENPKPPCWGYGYQWKFSGGYIESSWNSRGICQSLRVKRGFPKGLMQKKWEIHGHDKIDRKSRGVSFKKIDILNRGRRLQFLSGNYLFTKSSQMFTTS